MTELSLDSLLEQVLARNPSLAQMIAAWRAASARYPQVTSLEDPMFGAKLGPGSFGSNTVDFAYMLEVSQKLPFPGKLRLRGEGATAEANAAGWDVEDLRLQLIESTKAAFFDYFAVERALEVNDENVDLLRQFRRNAEVRYKTGLVTEQDLRQADVELGREEERRLGLLETRQIVRARLNTLMRLPPDSPLPPPARRIAPAGAFADLELADVQALRSLALSRRPDLEALASKIRAEQAALGLAEKEFRPDVEVMAAYDAFWQEKPLRPQIGVRLNLPVYRARRYGGLAEAQAKLAQRSAEYDKQVDQVNFQVQEAFEKVHRSAKGLVLYEKTILPAAKANVDSAQAAYVSGKIAFLSLIEAQRSRAGLRDRYFETLADYLRRLATLERVIGGPLPPLPASGNPPHHEGGGRVGPTVVRTGPDPGGG